MVGGPDDRELLKGTIALMVLQVVSDKDCYGYDLIRTIEERSAGRFALKEGTVYPTLHALERSGDVEAYWREASGRKRKYYRLTASGRRSLGERRTQWQTFTTALDLVLNGGSHADPA